MQQPLPQRQRYCPKCRIALEAKGPCPQCGWVELDGVALASMILGVLGGTFGLCPLSSFFGWSPIFGLPLGIAALVRVWKEPPNRNTTLAWWGVIGNGLIMVVWLFFWLLTRSRG